MISTALDFHILLEQEKGILRANDEKSSILGYFVDNTNVQLLYYQPLIELKNIPRESWAVGATNEKPNWMPEPDI